MRIGDVRKRDASEIHIEHVAQFAADAAIAEAEAICLVKARSVRLHGGRHSPIRKTKLARFIHRQNPGVGRGPGHAAV